MKKSPATSAFLAAVLISTILPFIPIVRQVLLPFDYLNTHLHELFHALAAIVTGGAVEKILVFKSSEGLTVTMGGYVPLIYSAGYIGASLFGAFMIRSSINPKTARKWCKTLGVAVLLSSILWVRGDVVGWPIGVLWGVGLLIIATRLPDTETLLVAQFLGVQQCINGFKSLRDLLILSGTSAENTDASMLGRETGLPATFWALLWAALGVYGVVAAIIGLNRASSGSRSAS